MEKFAKVFEIDKYQVLFVLGSDGDKNPVLRFETRVDAGALTSSITFSRRRAGKLGTSERRFQSDRTRIREGGTC